MLATSEGDSSFAVARRSPERATSKHTSVVEHAVSIAPQAPIIPNMNERRPLATECVNPVAAYTLLRITGLAWTTSVKSFD